MRPAATATSTRTPTPSDEAPGSAVKAKAAMRRPGAPVSRTGSSAAPSPALGTYDVPFKSSDPKPKTVRAAKETGTAKWVIDSAPRKDQVEQLHVQMGPCISAELLGQLFSKDHHAERDFLAALGVIEGWAMDPAAAAERCELDEKEVRARLGANLDLVFKYITIRLADTNTSMTMKCLDLVEQLFGVLHTDGLRMSDYEASILLPSLIAKVGGPALGRRAEADSARDSLATAKRSSGTGFELSTSRLVPSIHLATSSRRSSPTVSSPRTPVSEPRAPRSSARSFNDADTASASQARPSPSSPRSSATATLLPATVRCRPSRARTLAWATRSSSTSATCRRRTATCSGSGSSGRKPRQSDLALPPRRHGPTAGRTGRPRRVRLRRRRRA